jgi:catalase
MPPEDTENCRFNIFDVTKVWFHGDHSPLAVGCIVLDHDPDIVFPSKSSSRTLPHSMILDAYA